MNTEIWIWIYGYMDMDMGPEILKLKCDGVGRVKKAETQKIYHFMQITLKHSPDDHRGINSIYTNVYFIRSLVNNRPNTNAIPARFHLDFNPISIPVRSNET